MYELLPWSIVLMIVPDFSSNITIFHVTDVCSECKDQVFVLGLVAIDHDFHFVYFPEVDAAGVSSMALISLMSLLRKVSLIPFRMIGI